MAKDDSRFKSLAVLLTVLLPLWSSYLVAKPGLSNARSLGMGGAYGALALGAEAPCYNPANLSIPSPWRMSVAVLGVGVGVANGSFTKGLYDKYNGQYLSDDSKREILDAMSDDGLYSRANFELQALSISYRNVAFAASVNGGFDGKIAKDLFDILLVEANRIDKKYAFEPVSGQAQALASFGLSYGYQIPARIPFLYHLGVGVTVKYLKGLAFSEVTSSKAEAVTRFTTVEALGDFHLRKSKGGDGFAMDIGATATLINKWRVSLMLENVLSRISWHKENKEAIIAFETISSEVDEILASNSNVDSVFASTDTTIAISSFAKGLPVILNIGATHSFGEFLVAAEYQQGFQESALSTKSPVFSLGLNYRLLPYFRIRLGLSHEGHLGKAFSGGFGVLMRFLRWDVGVRSYGGILAKHSKGLLLGTGLLIRF
jgi:hypothetical protein